VSFRNSTIILGLQTVNCTTHQALVPHPGSSIQPFDHRNALLQVQYPDALSVMMGDLKQIRRFAGFIQKTEIKFDMLSAVDELAGQVELEFDFLREAKVMDQVADNLQVRLWGCCRDKIWARFDSKLI